MRRPSLSTQQVAELLGVPYTTLLKWQSRDGLLRPILGPGGRRGGDRWPRGEIKLARLVWQLRGANLPVPYIKAVIEALRAQRRAHMDATVYLAVHVRGAGDDSDRRIALFQIESGGRLRDASQLSCL